MTYASTFSLHHDLLDKNEQVASVKQHEILFVFFSLTQPGQIERPPWNDTVKRKDEQKLSRCPNRFKNEEIFPLLTIDGKRYLYDFKLIKNSSVVLLLISIKSILLLFSFDEICIHCNSIQISFTKIRTKFNHLHGSVGPKTTLVTSNVRPLDALDPRL